MRILLVDDSDDSRDLTEGALLAAGFNDIVSAASPWDALKYLDIGKDSDDKTAIDIALLDIVMPDMDGVEACGRIRNDPRYADLPIIMLTSLDDMDSLSRAFTAGATDYVCKPINRVELVARVRAAFKLKRELERRQERERELLSFLSNWGDRRAALWIDDATGLFVGEVAEAYVIGACGRDTEEEISIVALALDGFDAYRSANGDHAAREMLAEAARAIRRLEAAVGTVAASYRNGVIVLVAPEIGANAARDLGETLRSTIAKLPARNPERAVPADLTASVAAVTGRVKRAADRVLALTAEGGFDAALCAALL